MSNQCLKRICLASPGIAASPIAQTVIAAGATGTPTPMHNAQHMRKLDPLPVRLLGTTGASARAPLAFNSFLDSESSQRLVFHCRKAWVCERGKVIEGIYDAQGQANE